MHNEIIARATKDNAFRLGLLSDPKTALRNAGFATIGDDIDVEVHEESANRIVLVLPSVSDLAAFDEPASDSAIAGDAMSGCLSHTCSSCVSD